MEKNEARSLIHTRDIEKLAGVIICMENAGNPMMKRVPEEVAEAMVRNGVMQRTRSRRSPYAVTALGMRVLNLSEAGKAYLKLGRL